MKRLDTYLEKAIQNINEDREITRELLDDVVRYLSKDESHHKEVGITAAKYVETLQRSNEQLVKIAGIIQKKTASGPSLTDFDKNELFDMISGGEASE